MEQLHHKLLISNQWHDSTTGSFQTIKSPFDGSELGTLQLASPEQVVSALQSADEAFEGWKNTAVSARIKILQEGVRVARGHSHEIAYLLSREIAKSEESALSEVERSLDYMELTMAAMRHFKGNVYSGDAAGEYARKQKTGIYERVPLGVIVAISPFNYPINLSMTKIAPALLAGNTVVFKPSTQGSIATIEFYKAFVEAGLPAGVLNIITGKSSEIGDLLVSDHRVQLVALTGSTQVGNHIREVSNGIPLLLELGGKDIGIVTDHANLELAASQIVSGCFSYGGQRCTAQKIAYVYPGVADEFCKLAAAKADELAAMTMIDSTAADFVISLVEDAKNKGAKEILSGKREGNLLEPVVLDDVTNEMRIFSEEQFGPVLPIVRVSGEEEALRNANASKYGLQASVYSQDIDEAFRLADQLNVGTVQINARPDRGPDNFPFGGVKDSGQLMQGTLETLELMTRGKLTVLNLPVSK